MDAIEGDLDAPVRGNTTFRVTEVRLTPASSVKLTYRLGDGLDDSFTPDPLIDTRSVTVAGAELDDLITGSGNLNLGQAKSAVREHAATLVEA